MLLNKRRQASPDNHLENTNGSLRTQHSYPYLQNGTEQGTGNYMLPYISVSRTSFKICHKHSTGNLHFAPPFITSWVLVPQCFNVKTHGGEGAQGCKTWTQLQQTSDLTVASEVCNEVFFA